MDMVKVSVKGKNEIVVEGDLRSIEDYVNIRDAIDSLIIDGAKDIYVDLVSSKTIMSSVLGFFMKLINHEKVAVHIKVGSPELFKSLQSMHLVDIFDVKMR